MLGAVAMLFSSWDSEAKISVTLTIASLVVAWSSIAVFCNPNACNRHLSLFRQVKISYEEAAISSKIAQTSHPPTKAKNAGGHRISRQPFGHLKYKRLQEKCKRSREPRSVGS